MNRGKLLPAVYLVDQAAGDPEWLPHPVRLIGWAITAGEAQLRWPEQSAASELLSGALLTGIAVAASYYLTRTTIVAAYRLSRLAGWATEVALGWTCVAARNLHQETSLVMEAVGADDLVLARTRLARIVGRDTANLDLAEISRAVIETAAESACDGEMAPLFYMSLGGVPLAMAYKAVNTLDSMIGHADAHYFYFGKTAARLDDVANFIPARLTALAIVVGAALRNASASDAWTIWRRDGCNHKSPNAGQPESAMAGALGVRLGGGNYYGGEFLPAQPIGEEFPTPQPDDGRLAIRIIATVAALSVGIGVVFSALLQNREAA
jgi:adenosylcobinamide-phosphate synthase